MDKIREIGFEETYRLYECMEDLARHHNEVSVYFKGDYPSISSEKIVRLFGDDVKEGRSHIAVIEDAGKVIGFCKINISGKSGILDYLAVLSQERGKGHGTALMDWAFRKFDESKVDNVEVKVIYGNDAVNFYKKYGFREKSVLMNVKRNIFSAWKHEIYADFCD